ncbi:snaclec coagulation factor IX/factor X-binding protein subunit A-like [Haliotis rubra]|uniref:snaclec coagulation factor IX/factor X-binding protein subunit A-like n=1 Tax=Haliotis rubra TaxID=36100 RepID=UPI001EE5B4DA|nr:snaclec coagulation factor IX/factor X-binding protein subunit A-like [Haliotis rubra]XP_046552281.1 snaclec coagulation factor IX/factor X-binding protein subunit A-like [Haliotis rubra]
MEITLSVTILFHNLLSTDLDPEASLSRAHCVDVCFYNRTCASVFYDSILELCYQSDLWFDETVENLVAKQGVSHIAFSRSDCPSQWIYHKPSSKCFRLNTKSRSYTVATSECKAEGGRLFNIYSAMEDQLVITLVIRAGTGMWIGLKKVDGVFQWHKGTSKSYTNWYSGSSGTCVLMHGAYLQWFKYGCNTQRPSVCERVLNKQNLCTI